MNLWLDTSYKFVRPKFTLNDIKKAYAEALAEQEKKKEKPNGNSQAEMSS